MQDPSFGTHVRNPTKPQQDRASPSNGKQTRRVPERLVLRETVLSSSRRPAAPEVETPKQLLVRSPLGAERLDSRICDMLEAIPKNRRMNASVRFSSMPIHLVILIWKLVARPLLR